MTQGAGKIELLAAVMDDMIVPEKIYLMTPAMYPIALEIDHQECDDIDKNCGLYMKDRNFIYQPAISNDGNADTQHILYNIRNATAET